MLATSTHHANLAESTFPYTLSAALALAETATPFSDSDELSFVISEHYECEHGGQLCSAEIEQQRWEFRRLNSQWHLTHVRAPWAGWESERILLLRQFVDYIMAQRSAADGLFIGDSAELEFTHYVFAHPIEEDGVLYTYLPADMLAAAVVDATRLGYRIER